MCIFVKKNNKKTHDLKLSKHCTWSSVNSWDWQQEWSFSHRKSAGFRLACSPIVTESKLKINVTETQTKTWVAWGGDHKCYGFEMNSNVPFTMRNNTGERRQEIIHSYPFTPLAPFHQDHVLDLPEPTRQQANWSRDLRRKCLERTKIGLMRLKESQSSVTGRDFSLEWFVEWPLNGLLFKRAHIKLLYPPPSLILCSRASIFITAKVSAPPKNQTADLAPCL